MMLEALVRSAAEKNPQALAIDAPDAVLSYGELDALTNRVARALTEQGVSAGGRVALYLPKGARGVAVMQAALRLGAAYVPVDPSSPPARARMVLEDAAVSAVVTSPERARSLGLVDAAVLTVPERGSAWPEVERFSDAALPPRPDAPDALAYILYTSGSTGKPKGVCISQRNALAFIDWAAEVAQAGPEDRFSNHAPFHFDLSVLDLYAAFRVGASTHIINEGIAYVPELLVRFLAEHRISIWYSVPSALILMMERGGLLELPAAPPRIFFFAGEPFPIQPLRRLRERFPAVRMLNLYGPTETNVCTAYEVKAIEPNRIHPVPIGQATCGDRVWAAREDGAEVGPNEEGELWVAGPTVMLGYFGREPQGDRPYRTGDRVMRTESGDYLYLGRRDHMVKVHGYRIELGDVEAAVASHPRIREVAALAVGEGTEARLIAFASAAGEAPSLIEMKRHCAERLPRYMIVDRVHWLEALPRTGNGKINRLALAELVSREKNQNAK